MRIATGLLLLCLCSFLQCTVGGSRLLLYARSVPVLLDEELSNIPYILHEGERAIDVAARCCEGAFGLACDKHAFLFQIQADINSVIALLRVDPQLHVIILWSNLAIGDRDLVLEEIHRSKLTVRATFNSRVPSLIDQEVWFKRFYGSIYYYMGFQQANGTMIYQTMTQHKGATDITVVLLEDPLPVYGDRSDKGVVNVNMFDLKVKLRRMSTRGEYLVHASETTAEASDDLWFLFKQDAKTLLSMPPPNALVVPAQRAALPLLNPSEKELMQSATLHEVVTALLQDDWVTDVHQPWNLYASLHTLVYTPDHHNEKDNMMRAMLLSSPQSVAIIASLPRDAVWYRATVPAWRLGFISTMLNDTLEAHVHCGPVRQYVRTRAVQDVAGLHAAKFVRMIREVANHAQPVPIVVLGKTIDGPYTLVGDCERALVYHEQLQTVDVILGVSAQAGQWLHWCT